MDRAFPKIFDFSTPIIVCVIIQSFSAFVVSFESAYYMINNQYIRNITLSFLSTIANFGISFLFMVTIFAKHVELGRIYGSTFGLAILAFCLTLKILWRGRLLFSLEYWKFALKLSVPVIPHSLGNMLLSQFDRMMIARSVGDGAAGIYSFAYNISTVIQVLWLSINNAWIPWFYKKVEQAFFSKIRSSMAMLIQFFSILCIIGVNVLIDVGYLMGDSAYRLGIGMIVPISLGYFFIFLYGFAVNTEFYYKQTVFIGIVTSISALLNVGLNVYFIPLYGYVAGAYTTLGTFAFQFICHLYMGHRIEVRIHETIYPYREVFGSAFFLSLYSILLHSFLAHILLRYTLMVVFSVLMGLWLLNNFRRNHGKQSETN